MSKMNKVLFLERLMHERDKFEMLLNRAGFSRRMTMNGVSGFWSIKDILAHILAYEQFIADRLGETLHGELYFPCRTPAELEVFLEKFGYPDFDSPLLEETVANAWVVERYRSVPLEDIVAGELHAFSAIVSAIEGLPEAQLNRHHLLERVADHTYRHYREHMRDIRHWLKSTAPSAKS